MTGTRVPERSVAPLRRLAPRLRPRRRIEPARQPADDLDGVAGKIWISDARTWRLSRRRRVRNGCSSSSSVVLWNCTRSSGGNGSSNMPPATSTQIGSSVPSSSRKSNAASWKKLRDGQLAACETASATRPRRARRAPTRPCAARRRCRARRPTVDRESSRRSAMRSRRRRATSRWRRLASRTPIGPQAVDSAAAAPAAAAAMPRSFAGHRRPSPTPPAPPPPTTSPRSRSARRAGTRSSAPARRRCAPAPSTRSPSSPFGRREKPLGQTRDRGLDAARPATPPTPPRATSARGRARGLPRSQSSALRSLSVTVRSRSDMSDLLIPVFNLILTRLRSRLHPHDAGLHGIDSLGSARRDRRMHAAAFRDTIAVARWQTQMARASRWRCFATPRAAGRSASSWRSATASSGRASPAR